MEIEKRFTLTAAGIGIRKQTGYSTGMKISKTHKTVDEQQHYSLEDMIGTPHLLHQVTCSKTASLPYFLRSQQLNYFQLENQ